MIPVYQIALDGPAASGKSTTAQGVARELGIQYLDTGAMYRAFMVRLIQAGANWSSEAGVLPWLKNHDIRVEWDDEGRQRMFLGRRNIGAQIRENRVSTMMAPVCAMRSVRELMVGLQREIAAEVSCIIDGRDIGTVVFPTAAYKFFLDASLEVRARRRLKELEEKGQQAELETLMEEIKQRDEQDSGRSVGPLKCADDAILIDTSELGIDEQIKIIVDHVRGAQA